MFAAERFMLDNNLNPLIGYGNISTEIEDIYHIGNKYTSIIEKICFNYDCIIYLFKMEETNLVSFFYNSRYTHVLRISFTPFFLYMFQISTEDAKTIERMVGILKDEDVLLNKIFNYLSNTYCIDIAERYKLK